MDKQTAVAYFNVTKFMDMQDRMNVILDHEKSRLEAEFMGAKTTESIFSAQGQLIMVERLRKAIVNTDPAVYKKEVENG